MNKWLRAADRQRNDRSQVQKRSIHTFEGDTCCLLADTKVLELIFEGESLVPFESTLEWDLGGKNEAAEDDF